MKAKVETPLLWQKELQELGIVNQLKLEEHFHVERIQAYYDFLRQHHYFFSKTDQNRILGRHLYESMIFCYYLAMYMEKHGQRVFSKQVKLMDAGSGQGLPGFCFTCLRKSPQVFLLDSSRRRLGKLETWSSAALRLEKEELHFVYERIEKHKASYDCITARAFAPFPKLLQLCYPLQKKGAILAVSVAHLKISSRTRSFMEKLGYVSRETIFPEELKFLGLRQILLLEKYKEGVSIDSSYWNLLQEAFAE